MTASAAVVVGHRRKVERAFELQPPECRAIGAMRLDADLLALREAIRVGRTQARALQVRVERQARVHVQVTK